MLSPLLVFCICIHCVYLFINTILVLVIKKKSSMMATFLEGINCAFFVFLFKIS